MAVVYNYWVSIIFTGWIIVLQLFRPLEICGVEEGGGEVQEEKWGERKAKTFANTNDGSDHLLNFRQIRYNISIAKRFHIFLLNKMQIRCSFCRFPSIFRTRIENLFIALLPINYSLGNNRCFTSVEACRMSRELFSIQNFSRWKIISSINSPHCLMQLVFF